MKALLAIAATAMLSGGTAWADCSYPPAPEHIPDGNTASSQDMLDAQKAVKDYNQAVTAYLSCIQLERNDAIEKLSAQAGDKPTAEQKKQMEAMQKDLERVEVQKHNAAVDQLQSVAQRFNEQVKVYKAKNSDKSKS
jgi:molybdenum-dependent DNA-binding transcriptional regulator ModE